MFTRAQFIPRTMYTVSVVSFFSCCRIMIACTIYFGDVSSAQKQCTMRCRYNAVKCLPNPHKYTHCELWGVMCDLTLRLIFCFSQRSAVWKKCVILDRVVTALNCITVAPVQVRPCYKIWVKESHIYYNQIKTKRDDVHILWDMLMV